MRYVVVYDIPEDKLRLKVAEILEGFGERVQESVFECLLEATELSELTASLQDEIAESSGGNVRLYRVCATCYGASLGIGEVVAALGTEPWIIV